jgi:hypothetical protein
MNDLERIIKEMREDRDIWKSIARQLSREPKFEVWDADDMVAGDLESLLVVAEGHGYVVKRYGYKENTDIKPIKVKNPTHGKNYGKVILSDIFGHLKGEYKKFKVSICNIVEAKTTEEAISNFCAEVSDYEDECFDVEDVNEY